MRTIMNKLALTINEASTYTGIGRNRLRQLISWNLFPVLKIGNKTLIMVDVLDQFLKLNTDKDLKNREELIAI